MPSQFDYDYIVVGSGAGGGPLAANLARAGYKVLLLEAGADHGDRPTYQVPAFHGSATEDKTMEWDYFVRHFSDQDQQSCDSKFDRNHNGIWYPRAGTLGGCTAHNAMITVYPHNQDWDDIAQLTGDDSWHSDNMRKYFERLERCEYVDPPDPGSNPTRHGFDGWLTTSKADARLAAGDTEILKIVASAALQSLMGYVADPKTLARRLLETLQITPANLDLFQLVKLVLNDPFDPAAVTKAILGNAIGFIDRLLDPNDWVFVKNYEEGLIVVPLAVKGGIQDPAHRGWRNSPREYLLATRDKCPAPGKLDIKMNVLVTRVLFKDGGPDLTANGVAYVDKSHMYGADPAANTKTRPTLDEFRKQEKQVLAGKEVILCAGAFNTPQLLMLSGIGPKDQIEQFKGQDGKPIIACRNDLAGVGKNLQDRYEVGVISEMTKDFSILAGAAFQAPEPGEAFEQAKQTDPALKQWADAGTGLYATNGALLGIILKSNPQSADAPDLFIFAIPGYFKGYFQTYSEQFEASKNRLTWAILKAHTKNTAGYVQLRSADPRDVPEINFKYFQEGNDADGLDLQAVVAGVKFVRELMAHPLLAGLVTKTELLPGKSIEDDGAIADYVKNEAWGHHASCTCPIGTPDQGGVLDSRFRVHGVKNLRVVDASVFPRIPGFFIVTPIYMISEKASDVIIEDAKRANS